MVAFSFFLFFESYKLIQIFLKCGTSALRDVMGTVIGALLDLIINVLIVIFCLNSR